LADFLTPAERSARMARIRGKDTVPELALRSALHGIGLRYRLHAMTLPGKPDLVMRKHKAAIFVHGCFWHRHEGCKIAAIPKSNVEFWQRKFAGNAARDSRNIYRLEEMGWRVFVVWECELAPKKVATTARKLALRILVRSPATLRTARLLRLSPRRAESQHGATTTGAGTDTI
jgi:DNA mismatch endonuclease (patch repair protein)